MKFSKITSGSLAAALVVVIAIPVLSNSPASAAVDYAKITSASQGGGLAGLAAACKKEGQLNVIALPHDWADYGIMIETFKKIYGVKIDEADPTASSATEIRTAIALKGTTRSPDVFDIGTSTATNQTLTAGAFAPYKVKLWNYIDTAATMSPNGDFTPNYVGTLTIGYNATLFGSITKLDDLFDPKFKNKVALNGDPLGSSTALNGIFMINKALGGTYDDLSRGLAWFKKLKETGNFLNVDPNTSTIQSGATPVVIDNFYVQLAVQKAFAKAGVKWEMFTPALLGGGYNTAISAWAPHPACARLWLEFALGEQGAAIWSVGGATPRLWAWLNKTRRAPAAGIAVIGKGKIGATNPSPAQLAAASTYIKAEWAKAVGSR